MVLHKINPLTGRYVEDVILGDDSPVDVSDLSPVYVSTPIPPEIKVPHWNGTSWLDDYVPFDLGGESFIEQTTVEARLAAVEAATLELILGGGA